MSITIEAEFLKCSADKLTQLCGRIESCVDRLTPEQIWTRGGENQNAIGNLILHLSGNVRQWLLHGVFGEPDHRIRDLEFSTRDPRAANVLTVRLRSTVEDAVARFGTLTGAQLMEPISVQAYQNITKLHAILHVVEHFSYHTGQIVFVTKWLTGEDLGFYAHLQRKSHSETVP